MAFKNRASASAKDSERTAIRRKYESPIEGFPYYKGLRIRFVPCPAEICLRDLALMIEFRHDETPNCPPNGDEGLP
jgi:hypothetical protein